MSGAAGREEFVGRFGHVAEGSPWVAGAAWERGPFAGRAEMAAAFAAVIREAPPERQLALIRAHPELAGRAALAGELTRESAGEQASAGLDRLVPADLERVARLNSAYRERFGFPFVICVRGRSVAEILDAGEARLGDDPDAERAAAVEEIAAIIALRLTESP